MSELLKEVVEEEKFTCKDDKDAEWCMKRIRESEEEKQFWKKHYEEQYAGICATCDATIANMMHYLEEYFNTVPHKHTDTEENYRLPSGKLVLKQQEPEYEKDDDKVIAWLKANGGQKYIKTKETLDWNALKKSLSIIGETAADEDGQIIPCITVKERPAVFRIAK